MEKQAVIRSLPDALKVIKDMNLGAAIPAELLSDLCSTLMVPHLPSGVGDSNLVCSSYVS